MRFGGSIADDVNAVPIEAPQAGADRPGGDPVAFAAGVAERASRRGTHFEHMREHRIARSAGMPRAARRERIAPNAQREAREAVVCADETAISAGEGDERHVARG